VRCTAPALLLHALAEEFEAGQAFLDELCESTSARRFAAPKSRRPRVGVFCDPVAFDVAECRRVLTCARGPGDSRVAPVARRPVERKRPARSSAAKSGSRSGDHL